MTLRNAKHGLSQEPDGKGPTPFGSPNPSQRVMCQVLQHTRQGQQARDTRYDGKENMGNMLDLKSNLYTYVQKHIADQVKPPVQEEQKEEEEENENN